VRGEGGTVVQALKTRAPTARVALRKRRADFMKEPRRCRKSQ